MSSESKSTSSTTGIKAKLAIRGQGSAEFRAGQTERLTGGKVKARTGASMTRRGKLNPKAFRPGLHSPSGPQPFISKGRVASPSTESGPLSSSALKKHATSSAGSFGVSFSLLEGASSPGYKSQLSFGKSGFAEKKGIKGKSFITTTAVSSMQENPHSSGLETELIGRGHAHASDASMMQHSIAKRKGGGFSLTSRMWQPASSSEESKSPAGWGPRGTTVNFDTFDEAFERMYQRGVAGQTSLEDSDSE